MIIASRLVSSFIPLQPIPALPSYADVFAVADGSGDFACYPRDYLSSCLVIRSYDSIVNKRVPMSSQTKPVKVHWVLLLPVTMGKGDGRFVWRQ